MIEISKDTQEISTPKFDQLGLPVLDADGNQEIEVTTQTVGNTENVKYSVLHLKALGALQEAMSRIEQLEADVLALKNK